MAGPFEKKLYDDLLAKQGYSSWVRPVLNETEAVTVSLGIDLQQIIDIVQISIF